MRLYRSILVFCIIYISYGTCTSPTVNPECQSLADLINSLKKQLDNLSSFQAPLIPGLDPSKNTTLQCHEYSNCNGFNCSGQVYGRHIQFSFNLDYCAKPVTANISAAYPAEKISFTRTIRHSEEFFIAQLPFKVPVLNITIQVKLFGKISMTRGPGKVLVTAGIIPKIGPGITPFLMPFNIINSQEIKVDTSRCGDDPTPTAASGSISNQPLANSHTLSGGSIAAIVMSVVAFIAIVIAAALYWKRQTIFKNYALRNDKANSSVA